MNTATKIIIAIVVVVLIAAGAWLLIGNKTSAPPSNNNQNQQGSDGAAALTITYTASGFSPSTATVKSGETVKIINESDKELEFASDPHPIHTNNPELNTGDIEPGASATISPVATGEWGFHNHYDASRTGTLTVE